jgi:hypothetical protein
VIYTAAEAYSILKTIRYDLTAAQQKLSELQRVIDSFDLPREAPAHVCGPCKGLAFSTARKLREHRANVHGEYEGEAA